MKPMTESLMGCGPVTLLYASSMSQGTMPAR
jgi:hypothetical protein